ncbi:MAG: very short patch repair endonuclease [Mycobacterium sp.]|nr:very short patch repair endonuclease [Mycobacterium sp.]
MSASWASSPAVRRNMQAIVNRNTKPELALRRTLHALGLRYRIHTRPVQGLPRTSDIVFGPARVTVEVRGCFWHGCPTHYHPPATNNSYWAEKVQKNIARDQRLDAALRDAGWAVVTVWEHDNVDSAAQAIAKLVRDRRNVNKRLHRT